MVQRRTKLEKSLLSVGVVLVLLHAAFGHIVQTTTPGSNSSLTNHTLPSEQDLPRQSHLLTRSCGHGYDNYCANGGECMFPQHSSTPSCICGSSYHGDRCHFIVGKTHSVHDLDKAIGISFGAIMVVILAAVIVYCCSYRRCVKSTPLIKSAPSETSV